LPKIRETARVILALLLIFVPLNAGEPEMTVREEDGVLWAGEAWSTRLGDLRLAFFTGSPEEIGAQMYHLVVEPEFDEMMGCFTFIQEQGLSGGFFERTFKNFYANYKFIPAFKRFISKEYLRELEGFARATGDPRPGRLVNELLMSNAWQDVGLVYGGCSFFAAWGEATAGGEMIVGRNLDYAGLGRLAEYQSVNFYQPETGYQFVTVNYPSMVGIMHGMNEKGVVIAKAYSVAVPEEATVDGVPFTIMLRQALQYGGSIDEVIEIIKNTPRTVGLNILVADADEAVVLEVSAHRMTVRREEDFIYGANRFLSPYLQENQQAGWMSSAFRESRFERLKQVFWGELDTEQAVTVLRDKGEFAGGCPSFMPSIQNQSTISSMVFNPDRLEIWVSAPGGFLTTDQSFTGISAGELWRTGQPPIPIGVIPPTEHTGEIKDWQQVMTAAGSASDQQKKELLTPVMKRYPTAGYHLFLLGMVHLRSGEIRAGLEFLDLVIRTGLPDPYYLLSAHAWLGTGYDTLGQRERALAHYRTGLKIKLPEMVDPTLLQICRVGLEHPLKLDENGRVSRAADR